MSGVGVQTGRRVVGSDLARHDAIEKVAGRTVYAADFALPGMLHARLKRSDYAHARLTRVDTAAAEAIDGVVAVYTAADVPQNTVWVDVPGQTLEVGALKARSNVLADEVVRYHGEPIALVAAETDDAALAAARRDRGRLRAAAGHRRPRAGARRRRARAPRERQPARPLGARGGRRRGRDRCAPRCVVEDEYRTQFIDHAYLEPEAGVSWRDTDGVITIRAATQVVEHFRDVARILDLPDNKVRVITPYVGGGFGGKEDMTVEPYLGIVVALTGRPARMVWSRQESLQARQNRHAVRMRYRTAADADGRARGDGRRHPLRRRRLRAAQRAGAALLDHLRGGSLPLSRTSASAPAPCTRTTPRAARCAASAGMQVTLGYEGQMDRLAARARHRPARAAPAQLRRARRHAADRPAAGDVGRAAGADRRGLRAPRAAARAERSAARGRPRLRLQPAALRALRLAQRLVERLDRVRARRHAGDPDRGPRHRRRPGVVADPDRLRGARRGARSGSRSTSATRRSTRSPGRRPPPASSTCRATPCSRRRASCASSSPGSRPSCSRSRPSRSSSVADGVSRARRRALRSTSSRCSPPAPRSTCPGTCSRTYRAPKGVPWQADENWRGRVFPDFTYGCHAAEVEVDLDSGQTRVLRYVAAHDVGQAINPQSVEGQIEGAVAMGLGYALSERLVFEEAQNLTGSFAQYLIPTAVEVPDDRAGGARGRRGHGTVQRPRNRRAADRPAGAGGGRRDRTPRPASGSPSSRSPPERVSAAVGEREGGGDAEG